MCSCKTKKNKKKLKYKGRSGKNRNVNCGLPDTALSNDGMRSNRLGTVVPSRIHNREVATIIFGAQRKNVVEKRRCTSVSGAYSYLGALGTVIMNINKIYLADQLLNEGCCVTNMPNISMLLKIQMCCISNIKFFKKAVTKKPQVMFKLFFCTYYLY